MASCLCSLSNRKWPPLCCCCRLKAHRLARRLTPPFWSHRTASRQQQGERRKGGHGAKVRDSVVVVMAKEQWGKMAGREKELKHGDHSFARQLGPRSYTQQGYEARAEGLVCQWRQACKRVPINAISYLNTLFRHGGGGLKETGPIWILHINGVRGRLCLNA